MPSKPCNIVLLPSKPLADSAISISQTLASGKTLFTLKDGSFYPHVSLYMLELLTDDYPKVQKCLQDIAATLSKQDLTATTYHQTTGFLDVEYAVAQNLRDLQDVIISALNPLRNGMREKDKQRMLQAEGVKRDYFEMYGYPNVKELLRPHLTLTRFDNEDVFDTSVLPAVSALNGQFDRLGFFESGDNGTCVRLIAAYNLE